MSTYCYQSITVFGRPEDIQKLAPPGFKGWELNISFKAEKRNDDCFDIEVLTKTYPKLIFVVDTRIEVEYFQRAIFLGEDKIIIYETKNQIDCVEQETHYQYCQSHRYDDLKKLFPKKILVPMDLLDEMDMEE